MATRLAPDLQSRRRQSNRQLFEAASAITTASAAAAAFFYESLSTRRTQHDSELRGALWIQELLTKHPERIKNNLGVSQTSFIFICNLLQRRTQFGDLRDITAEEQLSIFLFAVATNMSMRRIAERFQHSTSTIHRVYHRVLRFLIAPEVYNSIIVPATAETALAERIASNRNYMPYFAGCIGAVDGTHIPVSPTGDVNKAAWRNRKGFTSQNVLAICDFEMRFTNVLFGWEGSAADSTLWMHANRSAVVKIPEGRYVLGDAGFQNCDACLVPYRNVRYHLQEWARSNRGPQTAEELFNMRHSQLRNVIERIFGVMKARYKILTYPRPFQMKAQVRVVAALCVLHNILNDFDEEDDAAGANLATAEVEDRNAGDGADHIYNISRAEVTAAAAKRDAIAAAMWADYVARRQRIEIADV